MQARRRKASPRLKAFVYAVLVHALVLCVLGVSFNWRLTSGRPGPSEQDVVQARIVDGAKLEQIQARKKEQELEKQRAAQQKIAEQARKKREKIAAEKKRAAEVRRLALKKKKEAEQKKRKAEAAKKKRELDKKRKADKASKEKVQAEARKREAERALAKELVRERLQRQAKSELGRFEPLIRQRVERYWVRPPGTQTGLNARLRVRLTHSGEVLSVLVIRSSGDPVFDRSVQNAVKKATPLPLPKKPELAEFFSVIDFEFDPQKG